MWKKLQKFLLIKKTYKLFFLINSLWILFNSIHYKDYSTEILRSVMQKKVIFQDSSSNIKSLFKSFPSTHPWEKNNILELVTRKKGLGHPMDIKQVG